MKSKRKLSEDDLKAIEGMARVRLPVDMMCTIIGVSKTTFERMIKTNNALSNAIERGKAHGSGKVRNTLYAMATKDGGKDQFQALKFWCQTQEGFKIASNLELSGLDGKPIETKNLSIDEQVSVLKELNRKLGLTEDK